MSHMIALHNDKTWHVLMDKTKGNMVPPSPATPALSGRVQSNVRKQPRAVAYKSVLVNHTCGTGCG